MTETEQLIWGIVFGLARSQGIDADDIADRFGMTIEGAQTLADEAVEALRERAAPKPDGNLP